MKQIVVLLTFLLSLVCFPGISAAAEGHDGAPSATEFRLGEAKVQLALQPANYIKDKTPQLFITLNDFMSNTPILDAEIYVRIEKAGQASVHAGHVMPDSTSIDNAGGGLDFGEAVPMTPTIDLSAFRKLQPQQKAGVYAAEYPLESPGDYSFTLAVASFSGKRYAEPLIYGGTMTYQKASKAPFYRMTFVISIILLSGVAGIWIMRQRRGLNLETGQKINILDIPSVKRFMKSGWFQPVFQIPVLIFFLVIIAAGLFDIQKGDMNIATILTWTIWWAAIIFTFVFVGRIWCMMCPFGAVQDWIGRLVSLGRDFPRPVRNIWLSSFIFFGLTWWDSYSGIVNKPALTSYLLLGFFAVAIATALVFKGRTFCRYVCPIGGLIGLYSMFSPIELRNKCLEVCRKHKVKECIKGTDKSYPCPMFQTPMTMDRNNYCNFCSECIKSCSQDNIVIRFRSFAKDLWVSSKGYMDEAYLALVIIGVSIVVTGEMVEPWHKWMDVIGRLIPYNALGLASHAVMEKTTFLIVMTVGSLLIPLLLLTLAGMGVRKATGPESPLGLKDTVVQFAYMFIPVGLSMHLAHNFSHLFKEGPGIVPAVQRALIEHAGLKLSEPDWNVTPLIGAEAIFWLQMAVFVILNIFSLYAGYRIAVRHYGERAFKAYVPMVLLAVFFMVINAYILGQPMALRHTH